jgi:hypothetical protein
MNAWGNHFPLIGLQIHASGVQIHPTTTKPYDSPSRKFPLVIPASKTFNPRFGLRSFLGILRAEATRSGILERRSLK